MKVKTKLIASIMSICLVCAVFAIGVFALRTANLKIGGDVSFSATGVEATISKYAVTNNAIANVSNHFSPVTINTTKTQSDIDSSASSWSGLDITIGEAGTVELDIAVTNNADTILEKDHYIEVDYDVNLGTGNNVKITMTPKTIDAHESNYIIAPGETDYFTISFSVKDIELNASLEDFVFNLALKHIGVVGGDYDSSTKKLTGTDGVIYTLNSTNYTASLEADEEDIGDNYTSEIENAVIAPVVTDGTYNYVVTTIGKYAFDYYEGDFENEYLESVYIPNSVTYIGDYAFSSCLYLTAIEIPNSVTSIGNFVFYYCVELATVTIGRGVTSIGANAFSACDITSITIPDNVTSIGAHAFGGGDMTSIIIPASVTSIGIGAFASCSNLTTISVESGNSVYDSRNNCNAIIETATNKLIQGCKNTVIPNDVPTIGESAFSGCSNLTSITISNGVTTIGESAFSGCSNLTSIEIPNGVTTIGSSAFEDCYSLESVVISATVTSIGAFAFDRCDALNSVKFEETKGWVCSTNPTAISIELSETDFEANADLIYIDTFSEGYLNDEYTGYGDRTWERI